MRISMFGKLKHFLEFTSRHNVVSHARTISISSTVQHRRKEPLTWSYAHGTSDVPMLGTTIGKILAETTEKVPDKTAYVFSQSRLTFSELLDQSDALASGLLELGIRRGDRVGIWAPNIPEWVITQYACARAGFILVNINPAYQTRELEFALRKVGVKAIVAAEAFKSQDYYAMLNEICPELQGSVPGRLKSKMLPDLTAVVMVSDKQLDGALRFSDVISASTNENRRYILDIQDKLPFDEPINIQFTSGTTGNPKGATLTHHNLVNNAYSLGLNMDFHVREDTSICIPLPLYHCFGMVMGGMMAAIFGNTVVFPSLSFQPEPTLQAINDERCTALYGTPTMFIDMLASPNFSKYDLTSLYTGIMAGSTCPVEVIKATIDKLHMPKFIICYGTTENSPLSFQGNMDDPLEIKSTTIGQPMPHVEVKVIDDDGCTVKIGQTGELCTRGYMVMRDYWEDPEKTAEAIGVDRWYHTGDLAQMDENGFGQIVGRIKDVIIRGGENIYPTEVENLLYHHPAIIDVQVIGVPDIRLGEEVCACVILNQGENVTEQDIKDFCKGKISHFKIPRYVRIMKEFPLTVSGKVQKYKMREHFVDSHNVLRQA